jgi:hypothetical protein
MQPHPRSTGLILPTAWLQRDQNSSAATVISIAHRVTNRAELAAVQLATCTARS